MEGYGKVEKEREEMRRRIGSKKWGWIRDREVGKGK